MKATPVLALVALLAACAPREEDAAPALAAAPADSVVVPAPAPAAPTELLPPERIYYELTRFQWYSRGEPLRHGGYEYQPAGLPMAAPLSEMRRLGEYEGVEYYRHENDDELLFVPVSDGYWLAFRPSAPPLARAD